MLKKSLVMIVLLACASWTVAAEGEGYVGAAYLSTSTEFDTSLGSFNPTSDSWKLYLGYNPHKNFGFEVTWYDMGEFEDESGATTFDAEIEVFDISFRGIAPIGKRFELSGKIGGSSVSVESETSSPLVTVTADGSTWELLYGIGVAVKLHDRLGIRADWESWNVEGSLDAWSIGAYIRF